ncbi:PP2C family protein-serine/threonine phosphatase [Spirosoma oryzicola]|uniref:PP2C family protein-serine/threonine phosphatase n=1 Tax=Spirosoma oryzicola TaxID=2898794 RepID=UPI001E36ABD5|nr:protein phosphatase 2C domain-containing protein [Spirosoma oryzicola]UHG94788.1 protein phosphatase 2C domain-containing protein [Spirosoma oryzicola]
MKSLLFTGKTDVGQRRTDNQDAFICSTIWAETSGLLGVIDGVGGYAGGDRAAAIAKESIEQYMATPNGNPLSMLREAVVFANNQINTQRQQEPRLAQMCCVLTTAVADTQSGKLYYVHVGDTRLYRYRQGVLEKLTYDHSLVGVREDANQLTEAEAMQHPRRNEILRDVGSMVHRVDDPDFLESGETDFLPGDWLLFCSDGLTDMITQAQIKAVLDQKRSLDEQTTELIRLANKQGGNDNITVVLAKNNASATEPAPALTEATETPASSVQPVAVPLVEKATPVDTKPARKRPVGLWVLFSLFAIGLIAAIVWYQFQPSSQSDARTADSLTISQPGSTVGAVSRFDSLLQNAYRSKDHRLLLPADTFRLTKPLLITDSLLSIVGDNRLTVLMPADSTQVPVALRITRSGAVPLENITISGFKTGIETIRDAKLQLSNVYFANVGLPISAAVRQDTFRKTVVILSVQNGPDSIKTRRQ